MIIVILIVVGLSLGSFINAFVWRIHEKMDWVKGRSVCTHCKHQLAPSDLLPVISWLMLKGKCRYCHKPISIQYPLIEITTALLFVISYIFWPSILHSPFSILHFSLWLIILTGLIALAIYDFRWMLLPDKIVFPLQVIAVIFVLVKFFESKANIQVFLGAFVGVLCSAGLFYVLFQVSKGKWIGGGDVKLAVVLGLVLGGAVEALFMLFIASALGSLIGIPLMLAKKTKLQSKLPFGPLLIVSTFIVVLFGASMIGWYKHQFLFI